MAEAVDWVRLPRRLVAVVGLVRVVGGAFGGGVEVAGVGSLPAMTSGRGWIMGGCGCEDDEGTRVYRGGGGGGVGAGVVGVYG